MADKDHRCRLCLIAPAGRGPEECARLVGEALSGGDVAAIIVPSVDPADPDALQAVAEALMPIAAQRDVALLVHNDTRVAGRIRADGVHIDSGPADVAGAVGAAKGKRMVGAGGVRTRHDAMVLAEAGPDYVFFGLLDGDRGGRIFDKALDLAAWWAEVAVVPGVVMGGRAVASVEEARAAGIEFVALSRAVFDDPRGPAAAVADANGRLTRRAEAAA